MKQFQYFQRSLDLERLRWTATFGWWVAGIRLFHSPDCRSQNLEAEFPVLLILLALHVQIKELFSFLKSIKHIYIFVKVQTYYKYNYADKKREKYVSFTKVNKKLSKCRHKCIAMSLLLRNFIGKSVSRK